MYELHFIYANLKFNTEYVVEFLNSNTARLIDVDKTELQNNVSGLRTGEMFLFQDIEITRIS